MHPFEIMADPVRRRVVEVLAVGEHSAGVLCEIASSEFGISRSAASHHLSTLRAHGVVWSSVDQVQPRSRAYRLNPAFIADLDRAVAELFESWEQRYGTAEHRAPSFGPYRDADARLHRFGDAARRHRRRALAEWDATVDQA
jgi:DNA-binding transcriptional ArsR family regulator